MAKLKSSYVLAAIMLLAGSKLALADQEVTYYTIGTFDDTSASVSSGSMIVVNGPLSYAPVGSPAVGVSYGGGTDTSVFTMTGGGTTTLTWNYGGYQDETLISGLSNQEGTGPLGSFSLSSSSSGVTLNGLKFTLSIYQLMPTPDGPAPALKATVSGTIKTSGSTLNADFGADVAFDVDTVTINSSAFPPQDNPPITYTITDTTKIPLSTTNHPDTTLQADITAPLGTETLPTPLPSVASMGMTMLGLMVCGLAGRKLTRRVSVA